MKIKQKHLIIVAVVAVMAVAIYFLGTSFTGQYVADGDYDDFAKCLTEKGAVMYGSKNCGHCGRQKSMFGDSFQYITYVECSEQQSVCQEKNVRFVPAWEINGELQTGLKSLEQLADMAGCTL